MSSEYKVDDIFRYHPPRDGQELIYEEIRNHAKILAKLILKDCPLSRERSLALTKLEESVMWANASVARN